MDPNNNSIYWCGGNYYDSTNYIMAVAKTTDAGTNWSRYRLSTVYGQTYCIAVDRTNSNVVYAGGNPGLYKTTDGGTNWSNISTGLTGYVYAVAINPASSSTVYAGTPNGVFKTTTGGASWTNTGNTNVKSILIDPIMTSTLYAGTATGVFKSTNAGSTWTAMSQGLLDPNVTCLGISGSSYLFASTAGAGVHRWLFTGVEENTGSAPRSGFVVKPNPTAGKSLISYALPRAGKVRLVLYDNQGRLVKTLVTAVQDAGIHSINYYTDQLAAGVYFIELATPEVQTRQKLIVVR
jgi:photosystem II stability/assembly factor-like uncharacterized protein